MDFGDKLRSIRELRGLSTTELAKMSGLSQSFISDIENKRRTSPTSKTITKLSKALRVPSAYFLEEDIITPFDVLSEIPDDVKDFMLKEENMPYLKLSKKAKEQGITPEMLDGLLNTLIQAMDSRKKS